jgi:hypothetical protein
MGSRRETVLDDWHAGLTAKQISQTRKIPIGSVTRYVTEARKAGDERAALRNASAYAYANQLVPAAQGVPEVRLSTLDEQQREDADEIVARCKAQECDAAALASLIKVHGHPSKVTTLAQASGAFRRRDVHPSAMALVQPRRDFGDPPAGRSALDQRRAG